MLDSLLKGFIVGMGASIPLGPLGVMCIQKTLSKGGLSGVVTGLGAALADAFFAALAILSLALIQEFIKNHQTAVLLIGGLIVLAIGFKIFITNPVKELRQNNGSKKLLEDFISASIMTITNPAAIFLILGLFAFTGLEIDGSSPWGVIGSALIGVFIGAMVWWITLSLSISLFRNKFRLRQLLLINRVAGAVIMLIGLGSFIKAIVILMTEFYKQLS